MSQLLKCPLCSWMGGDAHMRDPARAMLQKDEYIKNSKRYCHDNKEVTGEDSSSMIFKEGGPALIAAWPA